jgi:outer membrane lipoprotein SlyB
MKKENETKDADVRPGANSGLIGLIVGAILGGFSGILIGWVIWG